MSIINSENCPLKLSNAKQLYRWKDRTAKLAWERELAAFQETIQKWVRDDYLESYSHMRQEEGLADD